MLQLLLVDEQRGDSSLPSAQSILPLQAASMFKQLELSRHRKLPCSNVQFTPRLHDVYMYQLY